MFQRAPLGASRAGVGSAAFELGPARYLRCRSCRSLFDAAARAPEELRRLYEGEEYFVKRGDAVSGERTLWGYPDDYLADRVEVEAKFDRVLAHLERYAPPGRLLDVGSGPGFLLTTARRRGWEGRGVDLNEWASEYARRELGLDVHAGSLIDAELEQRSFDAVTMMDLIEHLADPDAVVAEAARLLRPGGALAILTPDAGSPVSRALGGRWPEVRRPGEHPILFSVGGLVALLRRHGFVASGWHSVGKQASLSTLAADVAPAAPLAAARFRDWARGRAIGQRVVDFDPRTKFCLYARRLPERGRAPRHRPARIPKRPQDVAGVEEAVVEELESLAGARRYCDWMFAQFAEHVHGQVAEVGAGIGTFSARILGAGAARLLAVEPEPRCAAALEGRFAGDRRVEVVREKLPGAPSLSQGGFDLIVCQNVLEHVGDDEAALAAMAKALAPGGRLALLVPAGASIFGPLDEAYGHWRRYEADELAAISAAAGLEVEALRPVNALGVPGWWLKNLRPGARIGAGALRAYEALLPAWRGIEERLRPKLGLSLFLLGRPAAAAEGSPQAQGPGSARR